MVKRFSVAWLCLMALSLIVFACSADTEPNAQSQDSESAKSEPEPTFVRVAVTTIPFDTPTPTAVGKTEPKFIAEQLADPVFPDWLDPEVATERPTDDEINAGWREFLADSFITLGPGWEQHLCADATVIFETIPGEFGWDVTRTAAMSSRDWGKIALTHIILSGQSEGRKNTSALLSRQGGNIWQQEITKPVVLEVKRSLKCLELAAE